MIWAHIMTTDRIYNPEYSKYQKLLENNHVSLAVILRVLGSERPERIFIELLHQRFTLLQVSVNHLLPITYIGGVERIGGCKGSMVASITTSPTFVHERDGIVVFVFYGFS